MNPLLLTLAPGVELRLVRVPAGEFLMGETDADEEADDDEMPAPEVYLAEFQELRRRSTSSLVIPEGGAAGLGGLGGMGPGGLPGGGKLKLP
jgi:hypothetical protein